MVEVRVSTYEFLGPEFSHGTYSYVPSVTRVCLCDCPSALGCRFLSETEPQEDGDDFCERFLSVGEVLTMASRNLAFIGKVSSGLKGHRRGKAGSRVRGKRGIWPQEQDGSSP